ncbi:MAG: glycosyltransferase [Zoogloea oleivorans]|jgi:GT2 family glycosyltransferase|uniref:glycosyltransferase n=1 Tax=Zoogloea oleivorans TaxID=1552750 RepID=UPI002A36F397|nr:glycosyltransferase [Zoogloea oleivorans]MDY0036829.1 glycosyltransferase [Zoogloea oleivorans]
MDEGAALTVSVVLFRPDSSLLQATLGALMAACREAALVPELFLIDNGGSQAALGELALPDNWRVHVLSGHGNVGFGRGHNLSLEAAGDYHLILNPDLELALDALREATAFMQAHPDCGLLVPAARWDDDRVQYLCKRMPTVFDLFLRGFAPGWLRRRWDARLARYEMRDLIGEQVLWDPPIVSGCCMLFRSSVLHRLGGFDPRFFLYFEDFDLSVRTHQVTRIAYVPAVRVVHHGGHAARKGARHIVLFIRSALRFFQLHGWRWY